MKKLSLAVATSAALLSCAAMPAMAQDAAGASEEKPFDGPYVGGSFGYTVQPNDIGSGLIFDTDRDGSYDDTVRTTTGADAFSPGFCNGNPGASATPDNGCRNDKDDIEYFARAGIDKQYGNFVVGALIEGGTSEARDTVSGFSTTPASYTFGRHSDYVAGARLRAGYAPGNFLFYATGGGAYARIDNNFRTTNTANSFADNGKTNGWGYSAGGGVEGKVTKNVSLGLEYLYTSISDDDYTVNVGPGTAGATNPFLLASGGTNIRRSDEDFNTHSLRVTAALRF